MLRGESGVRDVASVVPITDEKVLKKLYPSNLELKQVQMVFRHGDRTPISEWDPYEPANPAGDIDASEANKDLKKVLTWICDDDYGKDQRVLDSHLPHPDRMDHPCHTGQLTRLGKFQQQQIGSALRKIYINTLGFLSKEWNPNEIHMRSTDVPRTKQSLQNELATLYPLENNSTPTKETEFRGKKIEIRSENDDTLYRDMSCERLIELGNEYRKGDGKKMESTTKSLREGLSYFLNQSAEDGRKRSLTEVFDQTNTRISHSMPLKHGLSEEKLEQMEKISSDFWWRAFSYEEEAARLNIGRFVGEVKDVMKEKVETGKGPKLSLYSGHDSTIAPLLGAFKLTDGYHWPPYASNIRFELFQQKNEGKKEGDHLVRVLFNNRIAQLPACKEEWRSGEFEKGEFCPLQKFIEISERLTPKDFKEECKPKNQLPRKS